MMINAKTRVENFFLTYLKNSSSPLYQPISYSFLNGGKRIRPLLVYATGSILNAPEENLDIAACAVELIHTYSLIHDDLPAMDNADLRRGKPSSHKAFNEAIAILAGDALQTLAFEIISTHPAKQLSDAQRLNMISTLSHASGLHGMAGGQALDIANAHAVSLDALINMYQLKTGALLKASIQLGMLSAAPQEPAILSALTSYAEHISLAFQIQDDLLDIESHAAITGKPQGLDNINNKITYPALVGMEKTKNTLQELLELALAAIKPLGDKAKPLHTLANTLHSRKL